MKQAGLTNEQILRSATATAARAFAGAIGAKIGTIAPGQFADLVILNSNPLDDIAHASDIQMVMKNGIAYPIDSVMSK